MQEQHRKDAIDGLAFEAWLRSGAIPDDLVEQRRQPCADAVGLKFNPYHDPANGCFTSAGGGSGSSRAYVGMTAHGLGRIRPTSGGGTDRTGRPVPEQFAPDRYAAHTPAEALAHYVGGSGEARNYYFNKVDMSQVKLSDFAEIQRLIKQSKPGVHPVINALGNYNGGRLGKWSNASSAFTVGGLRLRADGVLVIGQNGAYRFNGMLHAEDEKYDFNKRDGRSPRADAATTFGRQLPGKVFTVYLIGSKPFGARGHR